MVKSLRERLIELLLNNKLVTKEQLNKALKEQKKKKCGLGEILTKEGTITQKDLMVLLSQELNIPPINLARYKVNPDVIKLIPERIAKQYCILPISTIGNKLTLAMSDPLNIFAIDDIKMLTKYEIDTILATESEIREAINNYYGGVQTGEMAKILEEADKESEDLEIVATEEIDISRLTEESKRAPIVKMVDLILAEALKGRASDIHIEPQERSLRIRYRVDGELYDVFELPKKNQNAVLARIKIMSELDITENRVPQDGRFKVKLEGREIDFRVSVLPASFGNKIVLRTLDKSSLTVGMDSLGFLPEPLDNFKKALLKPYGIILVTGPTGSGKSTTLYSILTQLNVPERNIVTVEDPVEYQVEGLTQTAVRQEIGLDFSSGLRSLLRQNPDVILIGEIRDYETADIAIKSSLTGHMVLSTLHTNDSIGAITRLANMGVEPFLLASSLLLSSAQRLLRRICPSCKAEAHIPRDVLKDLEERYPEVKGVEKFYMGKGCSRCNNTGYLGRLGTLETLLVDDQIREMIARGCPEGEIKSYLESTGFRTLRENAITKFCKGWTTLEEVFRVT
ncbi:MAG: Flp pilus assembly complex ATPase component TadA [Candidatus Omnitrophica bacterium]|nr:Flp pilus assembly complex ATPase component TadA [Candidatus Omnitrophota bacterium]